MVKVKRKPRKEKIDTSVQQKKIYNNRNMTNSNNNNRHVSLRLFHVIMLLCGMIAFLLNLVHVYGNPYGLQSMNTQQVLDYIHSFGKKSLPKVDAVVMPPCIVSKDGKTNYSVLSIFRFAPWIRRIHLVVPEAQHDEFRYTQNLVDYWKSHSKQKVVHTCQNLLQYSLTSPFLSEQFVVLKPSYMFTNYVFNWQFFINDSPVLRTCATGVVPVTRTIVNECVYQSLKESQYLKYALTKGLQDQSVRFYNNADHLIGSCSSSALKNTNKFLVFEEDKVRQLLRFTVKNKDRSKPYQLVLCFIHDYFHNLQMTLPPEYDNRLQMWIYVGPFNYSSQRLSFLSRVMVTNNSFLEIDPSHYDYKSESIGAYVMKHLRNMIQQPADLKIQEVYSYGLSDDYSSQLCNEIGNKIAKTYECPYNTFNANVEEWDDNHMNEIKRLQYL